jgi:hypothetical protein
MSPEQRSALRRIAKAIAATGPALHGSVEVRRTRCGNSRCACHGEPAKLHGPYIVWTRKVEGRTVTRVLSEEQLADYQPLFENSRRLRELVAELHHLTLEIIEADLRRRGRPDRSTARSQPA